jgi:hypothetical protein
MFVLAFMSVITKHPPRTSVNSVGATATLHNSHHQHGCRSAERWLWASSISNIYSPRIVDVSTNTPEKQPATPTLGTPSLTHASSRRALSPITPECGSPADAGREAVRPTTMRLPRAKPPAVRRSTTCSHQGNASARISVIVARDERADDAGNVGRDGRRLEDLLGRAIPQGRIRLKL